MHNIKENKYVQVHTNMIDKSIKKYGRRLVVTYIHQRLQIFCTVHSSTIIHCGMASR